MGAVTKVSIALVGCAATVGLMLGIYYLLVPSFSKNIDSPKYLDITIRLQNECSIIDEAFIAEAPEQHQTSKFYNGVAKMRLPETATVKLSVNPVFPDFVYDGVPETVTPKMVLVADCSISPRLRSIFGAMRERFGE